MTRHHPDVMVIDKHIGQTIKQQRENSGMTQEDLARAIGVTYQQIHKYEWGTNRVSASRLWLIANVLHLPIQQFFSGIGGIEGETPAAEEKDSRLYLEVARNFRQINSPRQQEALHLLVRTLSS